MTQKKEPDITWKQAMTLQRFLLHAFEHEPKENLKKIVAALTPKQQASARALYQEWKKSKQTGHEGK